MEKYKQINTEENYNKLLNSGMFWEFYPELTGRWEVDKKLILPDVVQAKPEEVFRWALFAQKLPDVSRNIDLMHIDGSIRRNFKMSQKELDDLNKWTPRKWRYAT